ncbi:VOC family protein [Microlunatus capsulatus]|uniref:Catechol 2,3-dioxygenase-like lactoylglutathione lyase family enzyme n=1 Tax=Microlunatus capsulatus TaxID=99117 RepID=A0ABS4ZDC1_9ACTN|nr:VOC family protein [Microlunatus capsulatus]MBP2419027.1 catechol 2,3-dioxygenase-like lactoylglutathione lyase family enzyme [Microlunatus capsulatus]
MDTPPEAGPKLRQVVLDTEDARGLAEFYRRLLGLAYRPGDEPPPPGQPDERGRDWLVLRDGDGEGVGLAFQQVERAPRPTWPGTGQAQMLHLDTTVGSAEELRRQHDRALELGATVLHDRFDDPEEPLYVFADPAGHPFCIFVA